MNSRTARTAVVVTAVGAMLALAGCSGSSKEVKIGESANANGIDVAVVRIEEGANADLDVLKGASDYAGRTPYYLHYKVTKTQDGRVGRPNLVSYNSEGQLTAISILPDAQSVVPTVDASGNLAAPPPPREFTPCPDADGVTDFDKAPKGESYEDCSIFVTDKGGGAPSRVEWIETGKAEPLVTWE